MDAIGFDFADFGGATDFEFCLDGFDISKDVEPTQAAFYKRPTIMRPQPVSYERAEEFAAALDLSVDSETFAFVSGNFVFGDFMEALVDLGKLSVRRMDIMTLSMNDENIDSIRNICEAEGVESLGIVLSDYWYAHERNGLVPYLFKELDVEGMELRVGFAGVHCKTWTVETRNGHHLTVEGSANLRSSRNIEQVHISPDEGLYRFVTDFTDKIIGIYDVVNAESRKKKSVRGGELWQAVAETGAAAAAEAAAAAAAAQGSAARSAPTRAAGAAAAATPRA